MNTTTNDTEAKVIFAFAMEESGRYLIGASTPEEAPKKLAEYLEEARAKGFLFSDEHKEEPAGQNSGGLPLPYHIVHAVKLGRVLQIELYQF